MVDDGEEIEMRPLTPQEASGLEWKTLGSLGREGEFEMGRISMSVSDYQAIQEELLRLHRIEAAAVNLVHAEAKEGLLSELTAALSRALWPPEEEADGS